MLLKNKYTAAVSKRGGRRIFLLIMGKLFIKGVMLCVQQ